MFRTVDPIRSGFGMGWNDIRSRRLPGSSELSKAAYHTVQAKGLKCLALHVAFRIRSFEINGRLTSRRCPRPFAGDIIVKFGYLDPT